MSETFSMIFKHCADDATESEIKTDCNTVIPMVTKCLCKRQHFLGHLPTALFPVPVILLGHMEELLIHCLKEWKTKIYYHLEKWSRTWWKNPFHLHAALDFALPSFSPACTLVFSKCIFFWQYAFCRQQLALKLLKVKFF